jgi:hypothetical protein
MELGPGTGALSLSPWMTKAIIRSGDPIPWTGNNVETGFTNINRTVTILRR